VYYKVGGLSLQNDQISTPEGSAETVKGPLNSNVALLSGLGAGMNYQLSRHFSLSGSGDINRTTDALDEVIKIYKIPYFSSHTVNNYMEITMGITYWMNFEPKKKASTSRPASRYKKKKAPKAHYEPWFKGRVRR
jgi:hypothetical protein